MTTNYQVTHIGIADIPEEQKKRLVFYTETEESKKNNIFFVRFSPAIFKKDFLENLIQQGKAIQLEDPIPILPGQMIWLDNQGNVFLGANTESDQKLKFLFSYKSILKARV